jgi:hypothetical protein
LGNASDVIRSESFVEKALLLALTACLSGLLVPIISQRLDHQRLQQDQREADQRLRNQKVFEADLARQKSVIEMQQAFLEGLEKSIFDFHAQAAAVAWYKTQQKNPTRYREALKAYDTGSWQFMAQMHAALSKGQRLTPKDAYKNLEQHQREWEDLDVELVRLTQRDASEQEWYAMLEHLNGQALAAGKILDTVATAYGLVPSRIAQDVSPPVTDSR